MNYTVTDRIHMIRHLHMNSYVLVSRRNTAKKEKKKKKSILYSRLYIVASLPKEIDRSRKNENGRDIDPLCPVSVALYRSASNKPSPINMLLRRCVCASALYRHGVGASFHAFFFSLFIFSALLFLLYYSQ